MKERPRISQHERAKYKQWNIIHTYIKKNEQKQINKKKGKCPVWVKFSVELNSAPKQKWDFPLLYMCIRLCLMLV